MSQRSLRQRSPICPKHDVIDAPPSEAVTHGQPGLAGADDDGRDVMHGLLPGNELAGCLLARAFASE